MRLKKPSNLGSTKGQGLFFSPRKDTESSSRKRYIPSFCLDGNKPSGFAGYNLVPLENRITRTRHQLRPGTSLPFREEQPQVQSQLTQEIKTTTPSDNWLTESSTSFKAPIKRESLQYPNFALSSFERTLEMENNVRAEARKNEIEYDKLHVERFIPKCFSYNNL